MDRSAKDCLVLFDTSVEGRLTEGWRSGVLHQRTKSVSAGPMVYVECYPVWDTQRSAAAARAEAKKESHRKAQAKLDAKNARKKLIRKINANFGKGDLMLTCEYAAGRQPGGDEQAARDIRNLMRRIKTMRSRRGLLLLKYIYITERTESAAYGVRWHHHAILSGDGMGREEVERLWLAKHGGLCNTRRAQPTEKHLAGFAAYLTMDKTGRTMEQDGKNPQHKAMRRRWNCSKNLTEPKETVADKKISVRKAGRIAEATIDNAREIFARLYPQCELIEVTAKTSRWAAGVYVYAELRRRERSEENVGGRDRGSGRAAEQGGD